MGLFTTTEDSKLELIRGLFAERIKRDSNAESSGLTPFSIRQLNSVTLLSTTEAAIVTIAESVSELVRRGVEEADAISKVEKHRALLKRGISPVPTSLREYILYRVGIEHNGPAFPENHVDICLHACAHFFEFVDDKGEAAHSIKYALLEEKTTQLETALSYALYLVSGKIDQKQFATLMRQQINAWAMTLEERNKDAAKGAFMRHIRALEDTEEIVEVEPPQPLIDQMSPDDAFKTLAADFGEDFAEMLCVLIDARIQHHSS